MSATVTFNPYLQSSGNNGLFSITSNGITQGTAYPDPSTLFRLRQGLLATTETLPIWGGVGVFANVPGGAGNPSYALGASVGRALALTGASKLAGFSVFDQAYGMITSPQSTVPLIGSGGQVNWYPLGSLARIGVACDPALVDLRGGAVGAQVSWDFTNQLLVPYLGTLTISAVAYNSTTGIVTLTMAVAVTFDAGDDIDVTLTGGTGSYTQLQGNFTALTASGTTVTYLAPTGLTAGASGGSLTVGGVASAALPVEVLDISETTSLTVTYAASTGFATWDYTGCAAIIQI